MGLFDSFKDIFSVGNTISQSSNIKPDDVLKTKNALAQIGHYKVPSFGITDTPDMAMINGLKRFQQNNGLKVDGIMKPNGPTESKIGETLANQTFQSSDVLEKTKGTPKPKVPKIDPLTGLPEIKMPKPKKPVVNVWGQANNENANPWFQSSKLKPVEDETHSANTRSLDGLLKSSVNGALPNLYADSIKRDGAKAINEYANFMQQLQGRNEDRVDGFHTEVVNRLPQNLKQAFAELETEPAKGDAQDVRNMEYKLPDRYKAFTPERIQQLQEAYAKDPEGFVQGNTQNEKVETTQPEDKSKNENDTAYEDSEECIALKEKFDEAHKESKKWKKNYYDKKDEIGRLEGKAKDALEDLKSTFYDISISVFLETVRAGKIKAAIEALKGEVTDPVNWADVASNAWLLYNNSDEAQKLENETSADYDEWQFWETERSNIQIGAHGAPTYCKTYGWYKD